MGMGRRRIVESTTSTESLFIYIIELTHPIYTNIIYTSVGMGIVHIYKYNDDSFDSILLEYSFVCFV